MPMIADHLLAHGAVALFLECVMRRRLCDLQKWNPKVLVVMGESHSSVIQDAFKQIAGDKPPSTAQSSILSRVMVSALRAQQQVMPGHILGFS